MRTSLVTAAVHCVHNKKGKHSAHTMPHHPCTITTHGFAYQQTSGYAAAPRATVACALAPDGVCPAVSGSGRRGRVRARVAHHRVHPDGRMGSSSQFTQAVSMALVPPLVRPHAAQLGQRWPREPQIEMGSHPDDGCEQRHSGVHRSPTLGCGGCMRLHGWRTVMAVAQARTRTEAQWMSADIRKLLHFYVYNLRLVPR